MKATVITISIFLAAFVGWSVAQPDDYSLERIDQISESYTLLTGLAHGSSDNQADARRKALSRVPRGATVTGNRIIRYSGEMEPRWVIDLYWKMNR